MARKLKNNNQEYHLQCWLALYLYTKRLVFCANAGSTMRTSIGVAVKIKRMGYKKGFPDIFIYEPRGKYCGMAIELKVEGYPSKEQLEWQELLSDKGYYSVIVPKLSYAKAQKWITNEVEKYLKNKP